MRRNKRTAERAVERAEAFAVTGADFRERVESEIGKPPYEFLDDPSLLPERFSGRKKRNVLPAAERARNPQPSYANFTAGSGAPQFIDDVGREYNLSTGTVKQRLVEAGEDTMPEFTTADQYSKQYIGTKAFDVRLPIALRYHEGPPDAELGNTKLQLFELETQVLCEGVIDSVYFDKRRRTGWMVLREFTTLGLAPRPGAWREKLQIRKRDPQDKHFDFDS